MRETEEIRPEASRASDEPWLDDLSSQLDRLLRKSVETPTPARVGTVGRFQLERLVGHGAFGVVYAANDPQLGRKVALKLPRMEVLLDPEKRQRFVAEANLAATLDHPGIVPVYEAQLEGPTPYIASMLVDGPDLAAWLTSRNAAVRWQDGATFVAEIADAIHFAHEQGVFHRDLKPSNILLQSRDGKCSAEAELADCYPRITDFGLAKVAAASLIETKSSLLIGTPLYMAPEQLEGQSQLDFRAVDIYSLGVILFELLTGELPRADACYAVLLDKVRREPPPKLSRVRHSLPKSLDRICQKCLDRNPKARYETADALAKDLRRLVAGEEVYVAGAKWPERIAYWLTRKERIANAGTFTIWSHILMVLWTAAVTLAAPFFADTGVPRDFLASCVPLGVVLLTLNVPMMWLGQQTIRRKAWAIPVGVVASSLAGIPAYISVFTDALFWPELYNNANPFFKFMVHMMLSLCFLISFLLYLVAWIASHSTLSRSVRS